MQSSVGVRDLDVSICFQQQCAYGVILVLASTLKYHGCKDGRPVCYHMSLFLDLGLKRVQEAWLERLNLRNGKSGMPPVCRENDR